MPESVEIRNGIVVPLGFGNLNVSREKTGPVDRIREFVLDVIIEFAWFLRHGLRTWRKAKVRSKVAIRSVYITALLEVIYRRPSISAGPTKAF
jgi:hypothetical protein